jgi:hypothetical protein
VGGGSRAAPVRKRLAASSGRSAGFATGSASRVVRDGGGRCELAALDLLRTARDGPFEDRDTLQRRLLAADERRRDAQSRIDRHLEGSELIGQYDREPAAEQDRIRREIADRAAEFAVSLQKAERSFVQAQAELNAWRSGAP